MLIPDRSIVMGSRLVYLPRSDVLKIQRVLTGPVSRLVSADYLRDTDPDDISENYGNETECTSQIACSVGPFEQQNYIGNNVLL